MPEIPTQPQPTSNQKSINWKRVLIVTVIGAVVIGLGVLLFLLLQPKEETTLPVNTKKATPSAKTSTTSAEKDETADWKILENNVLGYSIKYPSAWGASQCEDSGTNYIDPEKIHYSNPESSKVLAEVDLCSSDARTRITIFRGEAFTDETAIWSKYGASKHTSYKKEEIIVDGKKGIKSSYISEQAPGIQEGVEFIEYIIDDGKDQALIINYYQLPDDDLNPPYADYSDIVETMVSTLKLLD